MSAVSTHRQQGRARRILGCILILPALLSSGCRVGPDYQRPAVETPADWHWKPVEPRDHVPRGAWWTIFADPLLDTLEASAMEYNLDLQAAMARVEQARATARIDKADFFPTLNGGFSYARYRTSGSSPSPLPPFTVPSLQQSVWEMPFDLSYEVDLWGKVRRGFEASREQALSAEAARQFVLLTVQADVAGTYFRLQAAQRELDLLTRTIEIREEALELIVRRVAVGMSSEFESERGRVEVESAKAALAAVSQRQAELQNALAVLCGRAPPAFAADISTNLPPLPSIAPNLPSSLLERRPDVAAAERQLAARNAEIGVAQAAFFPTVRLTAAGGYLSGELSDLVDWDSRTWGISPSLAFPIFQGGRNKATLERARAAYVEGIVIYRQSLLIAFREVEDSLAALRFLDEQVRARSEAATAAANAARLAYERYKAGAVNFLEIVDAEQARLQNETARVLATHEQLLATVRLIKALGGGWADPPSSLAQIRPDPEKTSGPTRGSQP